MRKPPFLIDAARVRTSGILAEFEGVLRAVFFNFARAIRSCARFNNRVLLAGAKVLMLRCVEYARRYNLPIHVRSSYSDKPGTLVQGSMEDIPMEDAILTGVAHDRSEAKVTVVGLPDVPGYAAKVFRAVADADVNIDMVLQNISKVEDGKTDITFTCSRESGPGAVEKLTTRRAKSVSPECFTTITSARCR